MNKKLLQTCIDVFVSRIHASRQHLCRVEVSTLGLPVLCGIRHHCELLVTPPPLIIYSP